VLVRDYNGEGDWSVTAVQARYRRYCAALGLDTPCALQPLTHSDARGTWISPIMHPVIEGIATGDPACAMIGVEFIEQDQSFPFGLILKSRTARALRRADLPETLKTRIRRRVAAMLATGYTPREFKEYARLLRKIGFDEQWPAMAAAPPLGHAHAMRHYAYFRGVQERSPAFVAPARRAQRSHRQAE